MYLTRLVLILALLCSGTVLGQPGSEAQVAPAQGAVSSYDLLFIGNSHSSANGLPGLVTTLLEVGNSSVQASSAVAPGYKFLVDRIGDGETRPLLESRQWSHVFLQAQKYSTSGLYHYPTGAAEEWIRSAKAQNARPILFPEWPRKGNKQEGQRVHNLHLGISSRESACVAPVGLTWDASISKYPEIELHHPDGNHSNLNGALLTAYVFYYLLTEQPATGLPYVSAINVDAATQQKLKSVASEVVATEASTCNITIATASKYRVNGIPTLSTWGMIILVLSLGLISRRVYKR